MTKFRESHSQSRLKKVIESAKGFSMVIPEYVLDLATAVFPRAKAIFSAIANLKGETGLRPELQGRLIAALEAMSDEQEEITRRLEIDTKSESWLTRNIRPIALLFLLFFCATTSVLNSLISEQTSVFFMEKETLILWQNALFLALEFYFGGRAVLHIVKELKGIKKPGLFEK